MLVLSIRRPCAELILRGENCMRKPRKPKGLPQPVWFTPFP